MTIAGRRTLREICARPQLPEHIEGCPMPALKRRRRKRNPGKPRPSAGRSDYHGSPRPNRAGWEAGRLRVVVRPSFAPGSPRTSPLPGVAGALAPPVARSVTARCRRLACGGCAARTIRIRGCRGATRAHGGGLRRHRVMTIRAVEHLAIPATRRLPGTEIPRPIDNQRADAHTYDPCSPRLLPWVLIRYTLSTIEI